MIEKLDEYPNKISTTCNIAPSAESSVSCAFHQNQIDIGGFVPDLKMYSSRGSSWNFIFLKPSGYQIANVQFICKNDFKKKPLTADTRVLSFWAWQRWFVWVCCRRWLASCRALQTEREHPKTFSKSTSKTAPFLWNNEKLPENNDFIYSTRIQCTVMSWKFINKVVQPRFHLSIKISDTNHG